jgi:hypothetical protein
MTMMPCISADGAYLPPGFTFNGRGQRERVAMVAGVEVVQTLSSFFPRQAVVSTRPDIAGMNSTIFKEFAKWFVEQVRDLTAGCRKVLLLCDGYRCHMSIQALDTFASGRVIAYALPAHTSSITQPLDVAVFGPFKSYLNDTISRCSRSAPGALYDEFDFCGMKRRAYFHAFTPDTIRSAFANTGIWPCTSEAVLHKAMPASVDYVSTMVSVQDLNRILEQKRVEVVAGAAACGTVLRQGFQDTSRGLCLTSDESLRLARNKHEADQTKAAAARRKTAKKEAKEVDESSAVKIRRQQPEMATTSERHIQYGVLLNHVVRPMEVRRAIAKARVAANGSLTDDK